MYGAANTEHPDEVKKFMDYIATAEACDIMTESIGASGPYMIEGSSLPDTVSAPTKDLAALMEGNTTAALEFVSPIKGPNLENILIEIGTGQTTPEEGAKLYDEDIVAQAQQLGLEGW
jgi:raffinose/stachyose/melibiose transport system substrate-binding protein